MDELKNRYVLECFCRLNCGYLNYWPRDHRSGDVQLSLVHDHAP